jgi:hypothetical protein
MGYETLRPETPYLHAGNCGIVAYVLIFRDAINASAGNARTADLGNGLVPPGKEVLLAGPSDAGFYDPGCLTAVSLVQVTVCLLIHHLTITGLTMLNAMDRMVAEVEEAFADAEAKFAEEAERMHAAGEQPAYDEQSIP